MFNATLWPLYERRKSPGVHWVIGCVGVRARLDGRREGKIPCSHRGSKSERVQPISAMLCRPPEKALEVNEIRVLETVTFKAYDLLTRTYYMGFTYTSFKL